MTPHKSRKECCLLRRLASAGRMLFFMVEQVFLLVRRFGQGVTQIYKAQQRAERRLRAEKSLCLTFP